MSQITDQIKDRLDIVEIVREYVPQLKKTGANWKACCPFHQEKTASFLVSSEKQIWHCFGCAKGGDIFGFIREIEGVEFLDSLRLLAKRAGITLEKQDPKKESQRSRMLDLLRLASAWYYKALLTAKSADKAREYVKGRQITDKTRDIWQLGFAPDAWENVSAYLKSRGYNDQEISFAGLSSKNDRGSQYDRFRNRLMFPIKDVHGSIIGFTARKMSDDDVGGKYINTPETLVYHKSTVLYGLSSAKRAIREQDLAVIVEGNMDCISSHQADVENVVASSGTALTPEQIKLIKRFTKNICLAFDPDSAGQDALARGLEVAWQEEMLVKIIPLPEGKDPDDLIKHNVDEWKKRISESVPFMDWIIARAEKEHDLSAAQGKKQATKIILSWISRLPDPIEQTHYLQVLSNKVNVSEEILRSVILKSSAKARVGSIVAKPYGASVQDNKAPQPFGTMEPTVSESGEKKRTMREKAIIRLFALIVCDKKLIAIENDLLGSDEFIKLYKHLDKLYDSNINNIDEDLHPIAREILLISEDIKDLSEKQDREAERFALIQRLKDEHNKKQISDLREKIKQAEEKHNADDMKKYMIEWQKFQKNKKILHTAKHYQ